MRTAIHALAGSTSTVARFSRIVKPVTVAASVRKPNSFFRIVAQERGWRLAKTTPSGVLFLNKTLNSPAARTPPSLRRRAATRNLVDCGCA
ncbi:hypothetical protein ACNKHV_20225 [Shigella flexneri]